MGLQPSFTTLAKKIEHREMSGRTWVGGPPQLGPGAAPRAMRAELAT